MNICAKCVVLSFVFQYINSNGMCLNIVSNLL